MRQATRRAAGTPRPCLRQPGPRAHVQGPNVKALGCSLSPRTLPSEPPSGSSLTSDRTRRPPPSSAGSRRLRANRVTKGLLGPLAASQMLCSEGVRADSTPFINHLRNTAGLPAQGLASARSRRPSFLRSWSDSRQQTVRGGCRGVAVAGFAGCAPRTLIQTRLRALPLGTRRWKVLGPSVATSPPRKSPSSSGVHPQLTDGETEARECRILPSVRLPGSQHRSARTS